MVDLVVVPHSDGLDEIRVYFEDVGAGRGYITMICWGAGWTAYFGGMGEDTIRMFVERVGADYLVNKMGNGSHLKQRKVDDNYLRKIVEAVKKHLKANPVATYTMGIDEWSEPDYTTYQLIKDGKVVDEGPDIIPDAGLSMNGTPFNMEPYRPKPQTHSCFPYVAPDAEKWRLGKKINTLQKVIIDTKEYEETKVGTALYWTDSYSFRVTTRPPFIVVVAGISIRGCVPDFLKSHEEIGKVDSTIFIQIYGSTIDGVSYEQIGLEPTTWPTYGGITRSDDPNALKHGEYPNSDAGGIDSFPIRPPSEWFCDPAKYSRKELDVLLQKGSISEEKYNELMREKVDRIHREIKESQEED